ncbi:MAG: CU044_2847 family protein [Cyanobacteria bacterium J06592_8]
MKKIVEFSLENSESILVEVDEQPSGQDPRASIGKKVTQATQTTFEAAIAKIQPIANTIITKLRDLNEPADEVEVKFGVKMSGDLGVIVASGNAEVNYEITLKWKQK